MKKILYFLENIFELPVVFPIMIIYQLYVTYMIVKESNPADISNKSEEELYEIVTSYSKPFYQKYKTFMYSISIIVWLLLIKFIIF